MSTPKRRTLIAICTVIALTTLMHYIGWLSPIEQFIRNLVNPASRAVYTWSLSIGGEEESFDSVEELENAYRKAREELRDRAVQDAVYALALQENEELRQQLNFFQRESYDHVGATVIGKNIDPIGHTIIIDQGSLSGISVDQPVIVGDGVLIGRVIDVQPESSIVRLINDIQSRIAATVLNEDRSMGIVEGGYGISVRMNFIPQNEQLDIDYTIVTSGLEDKMPRGLVIGTVDAIEKEPYRPFQRAILSPMVNLDKLQLVSVLLTE